MRARLLAELLGTAAIVTTVLGAGFMVQQLQADAVGLLMIAASVGAVLFISISIFGPISGAHFNPIVSLAFFRRKELSSSELASYIAAQFVGGGIGALLANLMFAFSFALSTVERFSVGSMVGEVIASAGLVLLILQLVDLGKPHLIAAGVGLWIFAGHIFTSSTSFANPAVTIGRVFSSSPAGIEVTSALYFVLAQIIGLFVALVISQQLRKAKL